MGIVIIVYVCQVVCDKRTGKRDWKPSGRFIPEPSFRRLDSVCEADEPTDTLHQRSVHLLYSGYNGIYVFKILLLGNK